MSGDSDLEFATVGGGCFWCVEAAFKALKGVESVTPGYSGGETDEPTYQEVCSGATGHAEVVQIAYEPGVIGFSELLEVFFSVHDPTTMNRQGPDVGSQYRSIILCHSAEQKQIAEEFIADLEENEVFADPIVTEVEPLEEFYEAEEYHHDYYENHPNAAYCTVNIKPKLEKIASKFGEKTTIKS